MVGEFTVVVVWWVVQVVIPAVRVVASAHAESSIHHLQGDRQLLEARLLPSNIALCKEPWVWAGLVAMDLVAAVEEVTGAVAAPTQLEAEAARVTSRMV